MQYAAVFPLPVLALARISRPSSASGIAFAWISVGRANPCSANARNILGSKIYENEEND